MTELLLLQRMALVRVRAQPLVPTGVVFLGVVRVACAVLKWMAKVHMVAMECV